ncbi:MAG: DNA-3-methyladenine glycosylase [Candidatus Caldatribacteriota bacterium]|nr:DNA-3-methyladenine glycosylase [Candidatus Caldatribacteriota bacterium]
MESSPKLLNSDFFSQKTEQIAINLLGKVVVRKVGKRKISGIITETEAYLGLEDKACHSHKGLTPRTKVMFGPAGHWYVYLVYGMYHCLNLVTESEGNPCAVLIRSLKPISGVASDIKTDGPGKLCKAFKINKTFNGKEANQLNSGLYLQDQNISLLPREIKKAKRIGVNYAGEKWKNRLLRFYVEEF